MRSSRRILNSDMKLLPVVTPFDVTSWKGGYTANIFSAQY